MATDLVFVVVELTPDVAAGKGAAFVRTKLKNLTNGGNLEKTFRAGEVVEGADLVKYEVQFNYMDGADFVFMNMESFETETVKADVVGDAGKWIKEGTPVSILKFGEKILDIEIPMTMVLEVCF
jgi:elongation factor P